MAKSFKRLLRMEQAAKLEAKLYTDAQIAILLKMSPAGLAQLKNDPDYYLVRERELNGVLTELDNELGADAKTLREKLKSAVPKALDKLIAALDNPDPKISLQASDRILNRDGRFAEVSRIGLPTDDQNAGAITSVDTEVADALAKAKIKAVQPNATGSQTIQ